jgi:hypothetical protein
MYLQIYASVESLVQFKNRGAGPKPATQQPTQQPASPASSPFQN